MDAYVNDIDEKSTDRWLYKVGCLPSLSYYILGTAVRSVSLCLALSLYLFSLCASLCLPFTKNNGPTPLVTSASQGVPWTANYPCCYSRLAFSLALT
jgi:hypothetical protein